MSLTIISLGGSIIAPEDPDTEFLLKFRSMVESFIKKGERFIFICGGGAPARKYQTAYRQIVKSEEQSAQAQDWMGIRATHLNAELVKSIFGSYCKEPVVTNPKEEGLEFTGSVLVGGGWKPGFSTDTDAVYLAQRFGSKLILNLSNIDWVYTDDPRKNPDAVKIEKTTWKDFRKIVGDEWIPGKNTPFDPVASKICDSENIRVVCANGRDLENLSKILEGKSDFKGTVIG